MESVTFRSSFACQMAGIPQMDYRELRKIVNRGVGEMTGAKSHYSSLDVNTIKRHQVEGFATWQDGKKKAPIVIFRMSKGGVGKSTLTVNIAIAAAMRGYRVAVFDLDPQASTTELFSIDSEREDLQTIRDVLIKCVPLQDAMISISPDMHLSLLPADQWLAHFDSEISGQQAREFILKRFLETHSEEISDKFDIVFIDTAPSSSFLNLNAMIASDLVVAPMATDGLSQKAIKVLRNEVEDMQRLLNISPTIVFVANNHKKNQTHAIANLERMKNAFGPQMIETVIPENAAVGRQIQDGKARPVIIGEPNAPASLAMHELAENILTLANIFGLKKEINNG